MNRPSPSTKETGATRARRECEGFLAALGDRDRLDIADWSERRESRDIQEQEAPQDLMDPQEPSACRDTAAAQASQEPQGSPEERVNRESLDFQDLRRTSGTMAPQFRVPLVTPADPGSLVPVATKDLQGSQVFQEPQAPSLELECVDRPVSLEPWGQRERRAAQGFLATALKDSLVPPACQDLQASPDLPDPQVQESQV